jgi:hypothetical protein
VAINNTADLPLHDGRAPAWLFRRMTRMAGAIGTLIVRDAGPDELLRRLSDPFWFQAFGCVLGFDWHSSGVTTTVCGALKEAARTCGADLGIAVCGGKGATSRKAPDDIRRACDRSGDNADAYIRTSRLTARIDSAAVQDGYQLYHHVFFFAPGAGQWCVVQQGLSEQRRYARRYHWRAEGLQSFVADPHAAVACDQRGAALNLVAREADPHREAIAAVAKEHPERILREVRPLLRDKPLPLFAGLDEPEESLHLAMPRRHSLELQNIDPKALKKVLLHTYEVQAPTFERLLGEPGLGPQALRSLSLIAEVIYNAPASHRDPAAYSFAHGGKDGHPYRVHRQLYDANLERLREATNRAKIGVTDKEAALRAVAEFVGRL